MAAVFQYGRHQELATMIFLILYVSIYSTDFCVFREKLYIFKLLNLFETLTTLSIKYIFKIWTIIYNNSIVLSDLNQIA